jgi:hypothetical protein
MTKVLWIFFLKKRVRRASMERSFSDALDIVLPSWKFGMVLWYHVHTDGFCAPGVVGPRAKKLSLLDNTISIYLKFCKYCMNIE